MSNDLIEAADLAYLSGAPFTDEEVDDAVATLRGYLGWHVAPEKTETVTLDVTPCDPVLRLPTRHLVSVDEIRNVSTGDVIGASGYKVSVPLSRVRRCYSWPSGYAAVEVDMTHGFETCPPELRPILARMIGDSRVGAGNIKQESLGSWSVTYEGQQGATEGGSDTLARLSVRNSWPARL